MKKNILIVLMLGCILGGGSTLFLYRASSKQSAITDNKTLSTMSNPDKPRPQKESVTAQSIPTKQRSADTRNKNYSYMLGFCSLPKETAESSLAITGTIPSWLQGTFLSVGPAIFDLPNDHASHWLEGLAMVYQFTIKPNEVLLSNNILKSDYSDRLKKRGSFHTAEKKRSLFGKLTAALTAPTEIYDNVNVNILPYADHLAAVTETPFFISFHPQKLSAQQQLTFDDNLGGHFCCAHPHFDIKRNCWFNFTISYGNTSEYIIYSMPKTSLTRKKLTSISTKRPAYIHSFATTENYIIIVEPPFTVKPIDLLGNDKTFLEYFLWHPEDGTRFIVIEKSTGTLIGEYTTAAFFMLHHINAFENNEILTLDIATYQDPAIIKAYFFDSLKKCTQGQAPFPAAAPERFTIDLSCKTITRKRHTTAIEMPRINDHYQEHAYTFVYGIHQISTNTYPHAIIKLNIKTGESIVWQAPNTYPSEALFVPAPTKKTEDDGIVISLVLDAKQKKSFLLILDAQTMKEHARIYLDHHIPFSMHGFFSSKSTSSR